MRPNGTTIDDIRQDAAIIVVRRCRDWAEGKYAKTVTLPFRNWIWLRCLGDLRDKYKTTRLRQQRKAPEVLSLSSFLGTENEPTYAPDLTEPEVDTAERSQEQVLVRAAVEVLPDEQRLVIEAIFFEGLTQKQYAERVGVSQGSVSQLLARAKGNLRILMEP